MTCPHGDPRHDKCPDCSGEILVGVFDPITVRAIDEYGKVLDHTVTLELPRHLVSGDPHSAFKPGEPAEITSPKSNPKPGIPLAFCTHPARAVIGDQCQMCKGTVPPHMVRTVPA